MSYELSNTTEQDLETELQSLMDSPSPQGRISQALADTPRSDNTYRDQADSDIDVCDAMVNFHHIQPLDDDDDVELMKDLDELCKDDIKDEGNKEDEDLANLMSGNVSIFSWWHVICIQ